MAQSMPESREIIHSALVPALLWCLLTGVLAKAALPTRSGLLAKAQRREVATASGGAAEQELTGLGAHDSAPTQDGR